MALPPPVRQTGTPYTTARLKHLITIRGTYGGYDPTGALPSGKLPIIGALEKVEVLTTRGSTARRQLAPGVNDMYGRILEMVPGLVEYEATFNYVWLYDASFMEACGFGGHALDYQIKPMLFQLELPGSQPTPGVNGRTLVLYDCWLKDNPATFDVTSKDDLRIIQSVKVAVGGLEEIIT